jgi:predicted amidohydrolase
MTVAPWRAGSVQMLSDLAVTAPDKEAAWAVIRGNLDRAVKLIENACAEQDSPRLFVTPEFAFQGAPHDMGVAAWIDLACCPVPGPITEPLQHLAQRLGVYIGGNQFETTPQWPGRYFNTSFLIDPAGKIVLRYRRVTTAAFPSPHDFMDDYLRETPPGEVFPVVSTELGRLAMIACSEITVPEVARIMMMQGAEVILHPTNSPDIPADDSSKIARCSENKVYLISANVAGPIGFSRDRTELGGRSRIIDFTGEVLSYHGPAEETTRVSALIDIEALRKDRREDEGPSGLLRSRWEMYAPWFSRASFYPPNGFATEPMKSMQDTVPLLDAARANLARAGICL